MIPPMEVVLKVYKNFALGLLVFAFCAAGCAKNPADSVPSAQVQTPSSPNAVAQSPDVSSTAVPTPTESGTPGQLAAVEGTVYDFAEGTEVGFVGSKITGSHTGGFKKVQGAVTVPGDDLQKSVVELTIDMDSMYSDDEKLTGHLKNEDFFDVPKFPQSTFKSTSVTQEGDGFTVTGDLTMHGVTKSISFPAKIAVEGDTLKTTAEFSINRKDFGVAYAGKPDDLIRDEVVIKFDITAAKKA